MLITLISTLLGFVGVMFIFWFDIKSRGNIKGYIQDAKDTELKIVNSFKWLVNVAIVTLIALDIIVLYRVSPSQDAIFNIFIVISNIIFGAWLITLYIFFIRIYKDVKDKVKR